jgi:hypothetical protein
MIIIGILLFKKRGCQRVVSDGAPEPSGLGAASESSKAPEPSGSGAAGDSSNFPSPKVTRNMIKMP